MLIGLGLQRLSYLVPPLAGQGAGLYRDDELNLLLLLVTIGWNVTLFWRSRRLGWFPRWMAWVDVIWACVLFVVISGNVPPGQQLTLSNWSDRTGQAAAALAGAAFDPVLLAAAVVGLLLTTYTFAVAVFGGGRLIPELIDSLFALLSFAVVAGFSVRFLRGQERERERLTAERVAVESGRAAERARYGARLAHYRALHDTVLATLTAIARGGLDHRTEQVRQRCGRDADYVRRLLAESDDTPPTTLRDKLSEVIAAHEALGLRVHLLHDPPPADPPASVVEALGDAVGEGLNNVAEHAGVSEAWLTALWEGDTLTLRVVDRGRGFDPRITTPGFGLRRSVIGRAQAVGASATVSSAPGAGTCLELVWSG